MFWLLSGCKTISALFLVLEQQPFFVSERHISRSSKCFFAPKGDRIQPLGGRRYSIDLGSSNCRNSVQLAGVNNHPCGSICMEIFMQDI
jgi:hypothetical protein